MGGSYITSGSTIFLGRFRLAAIAASGISITVGTLTSTSGAFALITSSKGWRTTLSCNSTSGSFIWTGGISIGGFSKSTLL